VSTVIAPPSSGLSHVGRRDTNLATKLHGHGTSYQGTNILAEERGRYKLPVEGMRVSALVSSNKRTPLRKLFTGNFEISFPARVKPASVEDHNSTERPNGGPPELPATIELKHSGQENDSRTTDRSGETADFVHHDCRPSKDTVKSWLQAVNHCLPISGHSETVAVVDYDFNPNHKLFPVERGLEIFQIYSAEPDLARGTVTNLDNLPALEEANAADLLPIDHGNHVAGLIAGRPINNTLLAVDPTARLVGVKIDDFKSAVKNGAYGIFNLSLGKSDPPREQGQSQPNLNEWRKTIGSNPNVLFVIAAGNEGAKVTQNDFAGIGDQPNVIVVEASMPPPQVHGLISGPKSPRIGGFLMSASWLLDKIS
jgi:subtilase family protein